jgi:hypothetical protein
MANIPISSFTAAANATGIGMSGFSLTGANAQSMLDLAGTWNTSGTPTGLKLNVTDTASNAASLLMDLQTGGVSRFNVDKTGALTLPAGASNSAPSLKIGTNVGLFSRVSGSLNFGGIGNFTIEMTSGEGLRLGPNQLGWGASVGGNDLIILRDAANILAQRNGTSAQMLRIYETFTDASNYSRMEVGFDAGNVAFVLRSINAGTGTLRPIALMTGGNVRWSIGATTGHFLAGADNTYDIGSTGANRPRDIFSSRDVYAQSNTGGFYLGAASDVAILRDDANILAQRRATNPQTFRVYNTSTDASNYERGGFLWSGNRLVVGTSNAGTGVSRALDLVGADLSFKTGTQESNTTRWFISAAGLLGAGTDNAVDIGASGANRPRNLYMGSWIRMATTTVASLPAAATAGAGARMFVTDASAPVFGSAVAGGGAVTVPVYSTGSAWNVG